MKRVKSGHFCFQLDTPWPRRRSARLGEPEDEFSVCMIHLGVSPLRLGGPLFLGVALLSVGQVTVPVLFFLWLILEYVTLLFGLSIEDN